MINDERRERYWDRKRLRDTDRDKKRVKQRKNKRE